MQKEGELTFPEAFFGDDEDIDESGKFEMMDVDHSNDLSGVRGMHSSGRYSMTGASREREWKINSSEERRAHMACVVLFTSNST